MKPHRVTIELPAVMADSHEAAIVAVLTDLAETKAVTNGFEVYAEERPHLVLSEGVVYNVTYKRGGGGGEKKHFTGTYEGSGFGRNGAGLSFYCKYSRQYLIVDEEDILRIKKEEELRNERTVQRTT